MSILRCTHCCYVSSWIFAIKEHARHHYMMQSRKSILCTKIVERHKCRNCKYQTYSRLRYLTHMTTKHSYPSKELEDHDIKIKLVATDVPDIFNKYVEYKKEDWYDPTQCWICAYCGWQSARKEYLNTHIYRNHNTKRQANPYECLVDGCSFKSILKSKLAIHMIRKHMPPELGSWHVCPHCKIYKCRTASDLKIHVLHRHTPNEQIKWLTCEYCFYRCKVRGDLNKHIMRKHASDDAITWYPCPHCPTHKSKCPADLKTHILRLHTPDDQINWHRCPHCTYKSKMRWLLNLHLQQRHNIEEPIKKLQKNRYNDQPPRLAHTNFSPSLRCPRCLFKTKKQANLQYHIQHKHSAKKLSEKSFLVPWIKCVDCEFKTKNLETFQNHIQSKHIPKQEVEKIGAKRTGKYYLCSQCDFQTKVHQVFLNHVIRKHTAAEHINWMPCPYCSHQAKFKADITKHIKRKHKEEIGGKPVECPYDDCTYQARTKADLKSHNLHIHTPLDQIKRWFKCPSCPYKVIRSFQLKRHIKSLHKSINVQCIDIHDYAIIEEEKAEENKVEVKTERD